MVSGPAVENCVDVSAGPRFIEEKICYERGNDVPLESAIQADAKDPTMTLKRRIEQLERKAEQKICAERIAQLRNDPWVLEATRDTYTWVTQYTATYDGHWKEEGRSSPYEPFPPYPYFQVLFDMLESEPVVFIEKSRDMMISWACVAYLTLGAMTVPERGVLFQTQNVEKSKQLVKYAKCLYERKPSRLKEAHPLAKPLRLQPELSLEFSNGSKITGIPSGADQIRSYHPWGYLLDEASFVPDAGECYNAAVSAVRGKIILNSSAGPGWYADVRHDIIRNVEE